jgi:hypothetical protein
MRYLREYNQYGEYYYQLSYNEFCDYDRYIKL